MSAGAWRRASGAPQQMISCTRSGFECDMLRRVPEPLPGVATTEPITNPKQVVRSTLTFFASCILFGDEYGATCERAYARAMAAIELLS